MSQIPLSTRLKELERIGIVERRSANARRHEWHLTDSGRALAPVIQPLGEWSLQYAQDPLRDDGLGHHHDLEHGRRVDPNAFGPRRVTVQFEFENVPQAKRHWWIVNDRGTVDFCPTDPGFPIDIYITTDLRTVVHVWVGKLSLAAAIRSDRMEIIGPRALRDRVGDWFLYSPINVNTLPKSVPPSPKGKKPDWRRAADRQPLALHQRTGFERRPLFLVVILFVEGTWAATIER